MVSGSRYDGGTQILPARVRRTIESIKEIVGNHSDADIYVMLKESNMDPNETTQKLLSQDPFHEVKRRRDKKKENTVYINSSEQRRHTDHDGQEIKSQSFRDRRIRRGGYAGNSVPGISQEFRIVRDNRVNQTTSWEVKHAPLLSTTATNEQVTQTEKSSPVIVTDPKPSGANNSEFQEPSQALKGTSDSGTTLAQAVNSNVTHRKEFSGEAGSSIPNSAPRVQGSRTHDSKSYSATLASNNSLVGVYSSSTDPVHVPSPDSRSSVAVGAIRREVGVVGVRKQPSENSVKQPSGTSSSFSSPLLGKDLPASMVSVQPSSVNQSSASESVMSSMAVGRSFLSNQYHSKPYQQVVGHQKAPQPNMEWKPKSSKKSSAGLNETAAPVSALADNSSSLKSETIHLQEKLSQVNISDSQHVIIPAHLRVPEAHRTELAFGSFGTGFDSTMSFSSGIQIVGSAEGSNGEASVSVLSTATTASGEDASDGNHVEFVDDQVRSSSSHSPVSVVASEHASPDKQESSPPTLENYADIGLVRNDSPPFTSIERQQQQQQQFHTGLPSFSGYDMQSGYDVPFFRPAIDENLRGQGLPSLQEGLGSQIANRVPASSVAMVQQQPMTQLYPQVHVSHFPNFMPYRQILSPVYVPPMAVPGYSSNAAYPHPSNGNSYLLMPGGSSQLTAGGLKYGSQQYKPVPAGSPTAFGNYTGLAGYAPGGVGGATGLDDSTRIKYKEGNLYVPNPQAETSEIWIQTPRELPGMQSTPYYNVPGQGPHTAYLPSHTGHASFNAAAGQSTHVQYPGLYHPSQQAAMANPHHMVPGMGGNVGVGMAAASPGAQVGAYQQPQLSHLNWTTNF